MNSRGVASRLPVVAWRMTAILVAAILVVLALCGIASAEDVEPLWRQRDRNISVLKLCLVLAALGIFGLSALVRRGADPGRGLRSRRIALGLVAAVCVCANFNFFVWTGIHKHEFYNYYLGAKYAPELGYFGLFECTIDAALELGIARPGERLLVKDLRRNEVVAYHLEAPSEPGCDGAFGAERWVLFKTDVARFQEILSPNWTRVFRDHAYNGTPIWTLMGRPIASIVPVDIDALMVVARFDMVLLAMMLGAIGWAFGFEVMCVAALAWAANPHTRYQWVGDSFLRNAWLASAIVGICLMKKEMYRASGVLLALSSLLRIFPALFGFGYVLQQLRLWHRERIWTAGFKRFSIAAIATGLVLVIGGVAAAGRGPSVYLEFSQKISLMTNFVAGNSLGLKHMLSYTSEKSGNEQSDGRDRISQLRIQDLKLKTLESRRFFHLAGIAVFLALFWRASRKALDWEAAAMGSTLVLVLTTPSNYYLGFSLAAALLATRRPRIGLALLLVVAGWGITFVVFGRDSVGYVYSSAIGLLFFLFVLIEMQRAPHLGIDEPG